MSRSGDAPPAENCLACGRKDPSRAAKEFVLDTRRLLRRGMLNNADAPDPVFSAARKRALSLQTRGFAESVFSDLLITALPRWFAR